MSCTLGQPNRMQTVVKSPRVGRARILAITTSSGTSLDGTLQVRLNSSASLPSTAPAPAPALGYAQHPPVKPKTGQL